MTEAETMAQLTQIANAIRRVRTQSQWLSKVDSSWMAGAAAYLHGMAERVNRRYPSSDYASDPRLDPAKVAEGVCARLRLCLVAS